MYQINNVFYQEAEEVEYVYFTKSGSFAITKKITDSNPFQNSLLKIKEYDIK